MMEFIKLNEPDSTLKQQSNSKHVRFNGFQILPLSDHIQVMPTHSNQPNRHPTYLLNHFPIRPHYYLPHTVGAQIGYCLSPIPPFTNHSIKSNNLIISNNNPSIYHSSKSHKSSTSISSSSTSSSSFESSSSLLLSSAISSSLLSTSNTIASSSNSLSSCTQSKSLSPSTCLSKSKITHVLFSPISENHSTQASSPNCTSSPINPKEHVVITKKNLPIPPSLSNRVRQVFQNKINSQQAQSCAQLPRRKKKTIVEPVA